MFPKKVRKARNSERATWTVLQKTVTAMNPPHLYCNELDRVSEEKYIRCQKCQKSAHKMC